MISSITTNVGDCTVYVDYIEQDGKVRIDNVEPMGSSGNIRDALLPAVMTQICGECLLDAQRTREANAKKSHLVGWPSIA